MITRQEIINEAKTWIGTRWHHGQANKGITCDCVGFILGVGKEIGFIAPDVVIENYERVPRGRFLIEQLERFLVETEEMLPGNIIVISKMKVITHVGILISDDKFIHANDQNKVGVIESYLDTFKNKLKNSIVAIYQVPDVV